MWREPNDYLIAEDRVVMSWMQRKPDLVADCMTTVTCEQMVDLLIGEQPASDMAPLVLESVYHDILDAVRDTTEFELAIDDAMASIRAERKEAAADAAYDRMRCEEI